jgi:sterol desaturase/sphingolipid hydroxylase (fatty acid hydroxylase superfamily)
MRRRTIGPAFERAPAEKLSDWTTRNMLVLLSGMVLVVVSWIVINVTVNHLFNFLATGGNESAELKFDADTPLWVWVKVGVGLLILTILVKTRSK